MDQVQRHEAIKQRLANKDRGDQESQPAQEPAPGVPAPVVQDLQEPAPQVPTPPQPDPALVEMQERLAAQERELEKAREEAMQRDQEIQNMLAAAQEKAKLPSAKELDDMSQGEAIQTALEAMTAQVNQQIQGVVSDLNRNVVAPTLQQVGDVALQQKRDIARSAYPGVDMNKYRKAFDEMAKQYPNMPAPQVLKAVADPRDLSSRSGSSTTPTAVQPAGAHMEGGVSAHASAAQSTSAAQGQEPTVRDFLETSHELRKQGDRYGSDQARRAGLRKRLADQGVVPRG